MSIDQVDCYTGHDEGTTEGVILVITDINNSAIPPQTLGSTPLTNRWMINTIGIGHKNTVGNFNGWFTHSNNVTKFKDVINTTPCTSIGHGFYINKTNIPSSLTTNISGTSITPSGKGIKIFIRSSSSSTNIDRVVIHFNNHKHVLVTKRHAIILNDADS